jgi:uncharacterized protein
MKYEDIDLIVNEENHNFELWVDDQRAFIDYVEKGDKLFLIHTEVPESLKGKGVAEAIVEKTFQYLEANQLKAVPLCTYVRLFLQRHPEWERIVA